jgi:hypothetical protein
MYKCNPEEGIVRARTHVLCIQSLKMRMGYLVKLSNQINGQGSSNLASFIWRDNLSCVIWEMK